MVHTSTVLGGLGLVYYSWALTSDVIVNPMTSMQPSSWRCGSKSWCSLGWPHGIVPAQYLQHTLITSLPCSTRRWCVLLSFYFLSWCTWGCWGRADTVTSSPGLWLSGLYHHTERGETQDTCNRLQIEIIQLLFGWLWSVDLLADTSFLLELLKNLLYLQTHSSAHGLQHHGLQLILLTSISDLLKMLQSEIRLTHPTTPTNHSAHNWAPQACSSFESEQEICWWEETFLSVQRHRQTDGFINSVNSPPLWCAWLGL